MDNITALKLPPHSIEAEQAVLGCILAYPEMLLQADITRDDFYRADHREIFDAMHKASSEGKEPDVIVVAEAMGLNGTLENVGGIGYLSGLTQMAGTVGNLNSYTDVVRERAILRQGISVAHSIAQAGYDGDTAGMQGIMADCLNRVSGSTKDFWTPQEAIQATMQSIDDAHHGKRKGLKFGIQSLDNKYPAGMDQGELIVIGARPAMGKTSVALNIALKQKCPVQIFSLEMPQEQLTKRSLSIMAQVPYQNINLGQMAQPEWDRLTSAAAEYAKKEIYIHDLGGSTISQIIQVATQAKHRYGIGLIIIDYVQLINGDKSKNRNDEIGAITMQLKALAKRLRLPIIILAQLNRKLEERHNKRPIMADLRESGQIEQDADMVIFLYRDAIYNDVADDCIEFLVEKCRNGGVGFSKSGWEPELMMLRGNYR